MLEVFLCCRCEKSSEHTSLCDFLSEYCMSHHLPQSFCQFVSNLLTHSHIHGSQMSVKDYMTQVNKSDVFFFLISPYI